MIWYKFFDDPYVCGFLQIDKNRPYGGNVHYRPEIIGNINSIITGNIEYEWIDTHTAYVIFTQVPLQDMLVFLSTDQTDANLIDTLFSYAFNTIFYHDLSSDCIGILKKNKFIPPENIIKIEEW